MTTSCGSVLTKMWLTMDFAVLEFKKLYSFL